MDTDKKYRDDEFYVVMAGERPPSFVREAHEERMEAKKEDPDDPLADYESLTPARDSHAINPDVPVDGFVTFYDPGLLESGSAYKHGTFPFRSVNKDDPPWFARPDDDEWSRHPVWKWQNPDEDPNHHLTLTPSIGLRGDDGIRFHVFIRDGEIVWL